MFDRVIELNSSSSRRNKAASVYNIDVDDISYNTNYDDDTDDLAVDDDDDDDSTRFVNKRPRRPSSHVIPTEEVRSNRRRCCFTTICLTIAFVSAVFVWETYVTAGEGLGNHASLLNWGGGGGEEDGEEEGRFPPMDGDGDYDGFDPDDVGGDNMPEGVDAEIVEIEEERGGGKRGGGKRKGGGRRGIRHRRRWRRLYDGKGSRFGWRWDSRRGR